MLFCGLAKTLTDVNRQTDSSQELENQLFIRNHIQLNYNSSTMPADVRPSAAKVMGKFGCCICTYAVEVLCLCQTETRKTVHFADTHSNKLKP